MKKYIIVCSLLIVTLSAFGQTIERQVLGAGGKSTVQGIQMDYTIGEVITNTATTGSILLNQGFHQAASAPNSIETIGALDGLKIWPNPTAGDLMVEWTGEPVSIEIYTATGQLILSQESVLAGETVFHLDGFAAGLYLVKLNGVNTSGTTRIVKH